MAVPICGARFAGTKMDILRDTVDLNKLRHALAVARAGSFSGAAEQLDISQSALTRSVQLLEDTYGIRLFNRGKSGASLTLEGARFIAIAEEAIIRAQSTHDDLATVSVHQQPPVSFGVGALTAACFLPSLLPLLAGNGIRYRITIESNTVMQLMLRQGDLDFFVGGLRRGADLHAPARHFVAKTVKSGSVSVLVRDGHPMLSKSLTPANLRHYPVAAGSFARETLGRPWLEHHGLQLPSLELDEYPLMYAFVRDSDYLVVASDMLVKTGAWAGMKTLFSVTVSDQIDWAVVSPTSREISQPAKQAADMIFDLMSRTLSGVKA